MTDTTGLSAADVDRFVDAVRRAADEVEGTTAVVCPRGDHLRVARRWQSCCPGCDQSIEAGAVGRVTWDGEPPNPCDQGGYDWRHGCGEWNTPNEHTVVLTSDEATKRLEAAVAGAAEGLDDEDDLGEEVRVTIDAVAADVVAGAVAALDEGIAAEREEAAARVRRGLARDLTQALAALAEAEGSDDETVRAALDFAATGSDVRPGVYREEWGDREGTWVAWDYDPRDPTEIIEVSEDDLLPARAVSDGSGPSL